MKRNLFDKLSNTYNFKNEIIKIDNIFNEKISYKELNNAGYYSNYETTIIKELNKDIIKNWKHRNTSISYNELIQRSLNKENLNNNQLENIDILSWMELFINLIYLFDKKRKYGAIQVKIIKENIKIVLSNLNHCYKIIDEENVKIIVVEDREDVSSVVDKIDDENLSLDLIKYNHYELKGNITEKIKILTQAYKIFEEIKYKLKDNKFDVFQNDLGGLFNNLGIRHTINKDKNNEIHNRVNNMSNEELEKWCDRTYDMFLTAVLLCDYIDIQPNIRTLNDREIKD